MSERNRPKYSVLSQSPRIQDGPYSGQSIRSISPDRKETITKQLQNEFSPSKNPPPFLTSVQGRAMELVQMSYLKEPRDGGVKYNVFDANGIDKTFPAVDIFAVKKSEDSSKLSTLEMLQSKSHLDGLPQKRASQFMSDFNNLDETANSLVKRVLPYGDTYQKYGKPLIKELEKLNSRKEDLDIFRREEKTDDDQYIDLIDEKREALTTDVQRKLIYPTSPTTFSRLHDSHFVAMPVHTKDVQSLVTDTGIKTRQPVTKRKFSGDESYQPSEE